MTVGKWMAGAAGALVVATVCGALVLAVWLEIDPPPSHDNWDWVSPLFMLALAAAGAIVGGAAGGFGSVRLLSGDRSAVMMMGAAVALSAVAPVVAVGTLKGQWPWTDYLARRRDVARTEARRAALATEEAAWLDALDTPNPEAGLALARQLQSCAMRTGFEGGADALAAGTCLALSLTRGDKPHPKLASRQRCRLALVDRPRRRGAARQGMACHGASSRGGRARLSASSVRARPGAAL